MNKYLRRTIIGLCAALPLATATLFLKTRDCCAYLSNHKDEDVEEFVIENIEQLIRDQEEQVGFSLFPPPQKIEFMLPENLRDEVVKSGWITYGLYDFQENVLYLNSGMLTLPSFDLSDIAAWVGTMGIAKNVKDTLYHELGHYYCDRLYETMLEDIAAKDDLNDPFRLDKMVSLNIIHEGIGEYFERVMTKEEDSFEDRDWPMKGEEFVDLEALIFDQKILVPERLKYDGGYHLVKPIIDQYKKEGILYLLHHIPDNLLELPEYQQKALEELSQKN